MCIQWCLNHQWLFHQNLWKIQVHILDHLIHYSGEKQISHTNMITNIFPPRIFSITEDDTEQYVCAKFEPFCVSKNVVYSIQSCRQWSLSSPANFDRGRGYQHFLITNVIYYRKGSQQRFTKIQPIHNTYNIAFCIG